jgi:hypothetical protein
MDNTQAPIPNPPRAITSKDILYLKDALSWELLAFKKFHFLAQQVTNEEIKVVLENAGRMHQNHFERLLTHLQVNNNVAMSAIPNPNQAKQS